MNRNVDVRGHRDRLHKFFFPFHRVQRDRSDISDVSFSVTLKMSYVQYSDDINERLYSLAEPFFLQYMLKRKIFNSFY